MVIKGVGIGRGVAVGPVIRMAAALPEPSDAPRADSVSAESEIERVTKSLALVNADLNRRAEEAANGDEGAKQAAPILQAIAMFASDPALAQSVNTLIEQGKTAERAVLEGFGAVEEMFKAIGGYQGERAFPRRASRSPTPRSFWSRKTCPRPTPPASTWTRPSPSSPRRAARPRTRPFWPVPAASWPSCPPPAPTT